MINTSTVAEVLEFLEQASTRGLMPAATAGALASAVRSIQSVLSDAEQQDVRSLDLEAVIKRFNNKRSLDFNPSSLNEYGRRFQRAVQLYISWNDDPANFAVKTRSTAKKKLILGEHSPGAYDIRTHPVQLAPSSERNTNAGSFTTSLPIRADWVVSLVNVPSDLTEVEAEKLRKFIGLLVSE
ncbi:MAG: hypothetical protein SGJ05_03120 [bacterium]|nr:hypothetical protein [bacterium]